MDEIDYFNEDYDSLEEQLDQLTEKQEIKIKINNELEEAITELNSLKNKYSEKDTATLLQLCKDNVLETITSQFGIASLLLDNKDGGSVTTSHNFEKGITSSEADAKKYNSMQKMRETDWNEYRKSTDYDKDFPKKRREYFNTHEVVIDDYTGKPLPKDGRAVLDHIVSASEIENNIKANLSMTVEERAKIATSKENMAWTETRANSSKGKLKMKEWGEKVQKGQEVSNFDRFGIDEKMAMNKDKTARKFVNKEINKATLKKYKTELISTGLKDAEKMAAYAALGPVLRELSNGIMVEVRVTFEQKGNESFKEIFKRFKDRLHIIIEKLKANWKDILSGAFGAGLMAFLSNIVVFVINLFFTTLKKLVSMIRAGFVSLCQTVKFLAHPPVGMPKDEVHFQALKMLTAGIIGATSLGLSAAIEKGLQAIPGLQPLMMFPIPSFGGEQRTVSDIIAVTLSALAGGLVTTVVLYLMDKCRNAAKRDKLQIQMIAQSGVVVNCQIARTWCTIDDAYTLLKDVVIDTREMLASAENELNESFRKVAEKSEEREDVMSIIRARLNN